MTECTCGLDKTKKPCSMKDCIKRKQVRYWGLKKVDTRVLSSTGSSKDLNKKRLKLISEKIKYRAILKKLKSEIQFCKDKDRKEEIKKEAAEHIKKVKDINAKLVKIDKELEKNKK